MELIISITGFVLLLGILSIAATRFVKTGSDYYLAGRRMPWWALGPTIAAGLFGGTSMLVVSGNALTEGWSAIWILAVPSWVAAILATVLLAKRVRRLEGVASVPDIIHARFGRVSRQIFTVVTVVFYIAWTTSQLLALGIFTSNFTGLPLGLCMVLALVVSLMLAVFSGFLGVVITDAVMCIILGIGVLILAATGIAWAGGWGGMFDSLAAEQPGHLNVFTEEISPAIAIAYIAVFGLALIPQQDIMQRFNAARSPGHAFGGGIFSLVIFIPLYLLPIFTGLAAAVWMSPDQKENVSPDSLVAWLSSSMYGPWVSAFLFVTVAAAILSTLTTTINSGALNLTKDIYLAARPKSTDKQTVRVSRLFTLLMGIIALMFATTFTGILDALYLAFSVAFSGMLVPVIAAFYWKRANGAGAVWSTLLGTGFVVVDYALRQFGLPTPWPEDPYSLIVAFGLSIVGMVAGSLLTAPPAREIVEKFAATARRTPAEEPVPAAHDTQKG